MDELPSVLTRGVCCGGDVSRLDPDVPDPDPDEGDFIVLSVGKSSDGLMPYRLSRADVLRFAEGSLEGLGLFDDSLDLSVGDEDEVVGVLQEGEEEDCRYLRMLLPPPAELRQP